MSEKFKLNRKIFKEKTASDTEIIKWLGYCGINNEISCSTIRILGERIGDNRIRHKYIEHCKKYGGDKNVTIDKFLEIFGNLDVRKVMRHYGLDYDEPPKRIYQPEYIVERDNCSFDEALETIKKFKSDKATSKENFIKNTEKLKD